MKKTKFERLQIKKKRYESKLNRARDLRLISGLIFGICLFIIPSIGSDLLTLVTMLYWTVVFPVLVVRTRKISYFVKKIESYSDFLRRQEDKKYGRLKPSFYNSQSNKNELNITGNGSLFDFLNETWSIEGSKILEKELVSPSTLELITSSSDIVERQKLVISLAKRVHPIVKLKITMNIHAPDGFSIQKAFHNLSDIKKPQKIEFMTVSIWLGFILTLVMSAYKILPSSTSFWFLVLFWILQILSMQTRGLQFFKALDIEAALKGLYPIFLYTNKISSDDTVKKRFPQLFNPRFLSQFSRIQIYTSLLSLETHILANILVNLFFPFHILTSWGLSKHLQLFTQESEGLKKEISELDFMMSIVFLYVYHTQKFPQIQDELSIKTVKMSLPLIDRSKVIPNDFSITLPQKIVLITGSNMSGKSTFLRTIAQNQALAMIGAPVFAESFVTFKCRIESCINITDSVMLSYSYFLSEVKRLKEIFDTIQNHRTLYFLDELFRGTNQKERIIAAKSYVQALSKFDSFGFITTHDKELTEVGLQSEVFKTCYFEEDFNSDEISFTYKIKDGVASTTNALRILKREGLPVYENI